MDVQRRGSIAFFATYRPPVPLDIFSLPIPPSSHHDEVLVTNGSLSSFNGCPIPPAALKILLKRPCRVGPFRFTDADVDAGRVSGFVCVSDFMGEKLRIVVRPSQNPDRNASILELSRLVTSIPLEWLYDAAQFGGDTRMEDSPCFGGGYQDGCHTVDHSILYVSTKEPVQERRRPWTAVYKTNLRTGQTVRLTPPGQSDLSPAVSPSGMLVAVASFEGKGWDGEIDDLRTNIYVMNVDEKRQPQVRKRVVTNGGWPTWASENVLFFHRKEYGTWGVFRLFISTGRTDRVTAYNVNSMTPAAISETRVAVATISQTSTFKDVRVPAQYRHIEIIDLAAAMQPLQITLRSRPKSDHYNPFVLNGGGRVGYHRTRPDVVRPGDTVPRDFNPLNCPVPDVALVQLSGVFPTISRDGSKLAFVDNAFKSLYIMDGNGLRMVYQTATAEIFCPMWNQNPGMDLLYFSMGSSFMANKPLEIYSIPNVSSGGPGLKQPKILTKGGFNNAFPSSSPDGTKFVFRSIRRDGHKNLYVMMDQSAGEYGQIGLYTLTEGPWTDTHCQWSPNGDWIVFSSTRDKPAGAPPLDQGLDPGYFAVYLVKWNDPFVVVRVLRSGFDGRGHVNHPVWSPDGRSIAVAADFAAVSVEPVSMPLIEHSVRPYGDIFVVDIDLRALARNWDLQNVTRVTHSRYECSTPAWTVTPYQLYNSWDKISGWTSSRPVPCPYAFTEEGESWHMTGHLCLPKKCC